MMGTVRRRTRTARRIGLTEPSATFVNQRLHVTVFSLKRFPLSALRTHGRLPLDRPRSGEWRAFHRGTNELPWTPPPGQIICLRLGASTRAFPQCPQVRGFGAFIASNSTGLTTNTPMAKSRGRTPPEITPLLPHEICGAAWSEQLER